MENGGGSGGGFWVVSVESSELVSVVVSGQESVNVSVKNSESKSVFKLFPHCSLKYLSILFMKLILFTPHF